MRPRVLGSAPLSNLESISEQQRFQLLINSITDYAIYMLDTTGRITTWNPGAQRFKGYSADEIADERVRRAGRLGRGTQHLLCGRRSLGGSRRTARRPVPCWLPQ